MSRLDVARAGAGTGKTYSITERIVKAIVEDKVDAAKIIATTFTKRAATELKARIATRILESEALDDAATQQALAGLALAPIGTIDSIAYRYLSQHALDIGLSPRLDVLDDEDERAVIADALRHVEGNDWTRLVNTATRFGIKADKHLAATINDLLQLKRTNHINDGDFVEQMRASADRLCSVLHEGATEAISFDELFEKIRDAYDYLGSIPAAGLREGADKLMEKVRSNSREWAVFHNCATLVKTKKHCAEPRVAAMIAYAKRAPSATALHDDIRTYNNALAGVTIAIEKAYGDHKEARGLLDFTDLEVRFLDLLNQNHLHDDLADTVDLLIVDEFQDTNRLQLAIFNRLRRLAAHSYWVGDEKQAIYGFRGSDATLLTSLVDTLDTANVKPLSTNRRSVPELLDAFNHVFTPDFGQASQLKTDPERPNPRWHEPGWERWVATAKNNTGRIAQMSAEITRRIEAGKLAAKDVAILTRTNAQADDLAKALIAAGHDVNVEVKGLMRQREVLATLHGLRRLHDPRDAHAGAHIQHLVRHEGDQTPAWFTQRVRDYTNAIPTDDGATRSFPILLPDDPLHVALDDIPVRRGGLAHLVRATAAALNLADEIPRWGMVERRFANLDRLATLADSYERTARRSHETPTIPGYLAWLDDRQSLDLDDQAAPRGIEAITVVTYHDAKGLEWPTVILYGLDENRQLHPFGIRVEATQDLDIDQPFQGIRIACWPFPFMSSSQRYRHAEARLGNAFGLLDKTNGLPDSIASIEAAKEESRRLLYVGMTRAQSRLILAYLRDQDSAEAWAYRLAGLAPLIAATHQPGEYPVDGVPIPLVSHRIEHAKVEHAPPQALAWATTTAAATPHAPRYLTPHDESASAADYTITASGDLGPPYAWPTDDDGAQVDAASLGNDLHAALAATAWRDTWQPDIIPPGDVVAAAILSETGRRFHAELCSRWPGATIHTEVAVSASAATGQTVRGYIDVLVDVPNGPLIIIDHKSRLDEQNALQHAGQLEAYAQALANTGRPSETWIHLPLAGKIVRVARKADEPLRANP